MRWLSIVVSAGLWLSACSAEKTHYGDASPANAKKVALSELIKNAGAYEGQLVAIDGRMGDLCPDGEDFYFKDKFDIVEVVPPAGDPLPIGKKKGALMTVYGTVKVHGNEEGEEKEEGANEKEPEVKIAAKGVMFR